MKSLVSLVLIVGALAVSGAPTGKVLVRMIDSSKVFEVSLDPSLSVEAIKAKARDNWNVPLEGQTLYLAPNYVTLEDGHTLADYHLSDGDSTIWVFVPSDQSKLVFVREIGATRPEDSLKIPFEATHTIGSIKATIEHNWDVPADKQTLYFGPNYVTMDDDRTLADYKVTGDTKPQVDSTIWLFVAEDESQRGVFVRRIDDSTSQAFQLPLVEADSVATLKAHIQDILNVPVADQTLFFGPNHVAMDDDEQTLGHYNIAPDDQLRPDSTIWLFVANQERANQNNQLFIRELGESKTLSLPVDKSETIGSLKSKIQANWGVPVAKQTLYLPPHYTVLENDQTIGDYKIEGTDRARLESIIWLSIDKK